MLGWFSRFHENCDYPGTTPAVFLEKSGMSGMYVFSEERGPNDGNGLVQVGFTHGHGRPFLFWFLLPGPKMSGSERFSAHEPFGPKIVKPPNEKWGEPGMVSKHANSPVCWRGPIGCEILSCFSKKLVCGGCPACPCLYGHPGKKKQTLR